MRKLTGVEEARARKYLELAAELARRFATCRRWQCGSCVVQNGEVIGIGFNTPPGNDESERRCHLSKRGLSDKITDRSCCMHAEQRAIRNFFEQGNGKRIKGSTIYFSRIEKDGQMKFAGKPHCTLCSREVLDAGIAFFVLWHEDGIYEYTAKEYNWISYQFTYN